ncbi:MAG: DUF262 domain-containing protein [Candidatus Omnitrophota bacterium]|nr:DUF262 domain-containing protein [Candidatus Omnitrophota bacterium]
MADIKREYEGDHEVEEEYLVLEYDITASPNDFNIKTIFDFIESGAVIIPEFQRNYVWDIRRGSKFIESLIMNLPVPQIFLYESGRNKFKVIDGQQRLMTIYYFMKKRFPWKEKRMELRRIFDKAGKIPPEVLADDKFFSDFNLKLESSVEGVTSRLNGLNYDTLKDYKTSFDLRTIRNIIVKQTKPEDDDSSMYEIFTRLNSGGINLTPQEIRACMFHSDFYDTLHKVNLDERWRKIIGSKDPDLHLKDVEILLRSYAALIKGENYAPPMTKFLNTFSKEREKETRKSLDYYEKLFYSFLDYCSELREKSFFGKTGKFNISLFEAVFYAICEKSYKKHSLVEGKIEAIKLNRLKRDKQFTGASQMRLSSKQNVAIRLDRARKIIL